jgi:flagellar M-ring protein FliF
VRATVTADVDFTVTEETHENYDPQKTAVRSEQTSSDTRKSGEGAEGIPGALSNQPPGTAGAPPNLAGPASVTPGAGESASNTPTSSSQRSTRNFEVDRTLQYVKQPVGSLKRLSVGVVLDDWQKVGSDGTVTTTPMSDTDIKRFTELVRQSIGLKADRGDQINVLNQTFKTDAPPPAPEPTPIWEQPWVKSVGKQVVGAVLVLVLAFLVLKPLMKSLTTAAARIGAGGGVSADQGDDRVTLSGQGGNPIKLSPSFEQQIAAARTLVGQDPRRAAQVVKEWVATDG